MHKAFSSALCLAILAVLPIVWAAGCTLPNTDPPPLNLTYSVNLAPLTTTWGANGIFVAGIWGGNGVELQFSGVNSPVWSIGTFSSTNLGSTASTSPDVSVPGFANYTITTLTSWAGFDCTLDGQAGSDNVHLSIHVTYSTRLPRRGSSQMRDPIR